MLANKLQTVVGTEFINSRVFAVLVACLSWLLMILVVSSTPQSLYSDPGWQMRALQQHIVGLSPSFNHLVQPARFDLSQNNPGWISFWAPGTNLIAYPLMSWQMSPGQSIRIIAASCLLIGAIGWALWLSLFAIPIWIRMALVILLPWMRYASNALFMYSAEILVFAIAPWLLLSVWHLVQRWKQAEVDIVPNIGLALATGFFLGTTYILKYSAILVALGLLAYLGIIVLRYFTWRRLSFYGCVLCGFAVPVLALSLLNQSMSGEANLMTSSLSLNLRPANFLFTLGNPALAIADLDSLLHYIFLHPSHGLISNPLIIGLIGIPGSVLIGYLLLKSTFVDDAGLLAATVFIVSITALLVIWSLADNINHRTRYIVVVCLAILPLLIQSGLNIWQRPGLPHKILLGSFGLVYLVIPLAYGVGSVFAKVQRTPSDYVTGYGQIYNPLMSNSNIPLIRDAVTAEANLDTDILYLTTPITALDIPGRAIIRHADFLAIERLQRETFNTSRPMRVFALLPRKFEDNGKGQVIRESFPQAVTWEKLSLPDGQLYLWKAELQVDQNELLR
jgi:hypothetical protein